MYATCRPFVAAGVAMVGASAIAMSPVAVQPAYFRAEAAIQLTAATNWQDVLTVAGQNASALFTSWLQTPVPILQQVIANQQKYLTELPDLATIGARIQANLQHALGALAVADPTTLDATHRTLYQLLPTVLQIPGIPDLLHFNISATGQQLLGVSTTALSGVLLGLAGPVLGPLLALGSSLGSIVNDLNAPTPDLAGALSTLANIPAAMTDAFLNGGQHVDLTALMTAIGPSIGVSFPAGVQVGIALGGLLSPGGSIFNALDMAYDNNLLGVLHIHVPIATGAPVGPIGAFLELARSIARAVGWNNATTAAAAPNGLAAVDTVPASVLNSGSAVRPPIVAVDQSAVDAATSPGQGLTLPDRTIRGIASLGATSSASKRTGSHSSVGSQRDRAEASASDSGAAAAARTTRSAG